MGENKDVFFWPFTFRPGSEAEALAAILCFPPLTDEWIPRSFPRLSVDLPFDLSALGSEVSLRHALSEPSCVSDRALSRSDASCSCSHTWPRFAFNTWEQGRRWLIHQCGGLRECRDENTELQRLTSREWLVDGSWSFQLFFFFFFFLIFTPPLPASISSSSLDSRNLFLCPSPASESSEYCSGLPSLRHGNVNKVCSAKLKT